VPEDPELRRRTMQAVKSKDSEAEMTVRRLVHALGYRYRLHRKDLPGCPDLVFPARQKAIFIHGCFWHGHNCPRGARVPKTNTEYWAGKIARNRVRDRKVRASLRAVGWTTMVIWECQTRRPNLIARLKRFLND
jgi:DNA mismatch endonuclease (patch repair protein)